MLYEYRHVGRRRRSCPKTFELMRSVSQRDDTAPCPKCGNSETERIKFQTFAVSNVGTDAKSTIARRQSGSGPYDDFDAASIPDDDDSDL